MSKLRSFALASLAAGKRLELFDLELVQQAPPEDFDVVSAAASLAPQFTAFVRRTADAVEWCVERHRETNLDDLTIIEKAAAKFGVSPEAVERGWLEKNSSKLNELLRIRRGRR